MTQQGTIVIERMDGTAAAQAEDAFRLISSAAYRAWGYRRIGEARPWGTGADLHDVMLLDLH